MYQNCKWNVSVEYSVEATCWKTIVAGDANLDGTVDIADVVVLSSYVGDGLTSGDILMIQQYIVEIIKTLN